METRFHRKDDFFKLTVYCEFVLSLKTGFSSVMSELSPLDDNMTLSSFVGSAATAFGRIVLPTGQTKSDSFVRLMR